MQRKKEETFELRLSVTIVFRATRDPNKYDPLSPKNILALGKLNRRKEIKIIIWAVKKNENSNLSLLRFIKSKTELIIIKLIVKRPLKPSIKLAPFIMNKKHKSTKIVEKNLFSSQVSRKIKSMCWISIGRIFIKITKNNIINDNLKFGLILILISSKYPIKNILVHKKMYS